MNNHQLNSYKYGTNPSDNVSNYLTKVNNDQVALNYKYRGGNKTMNVPSFNIINPATWYEGTVMSQRTNSLLLNALRNNVKGGAKTKSKKTKSKKTKSKLDFRKVLVEEVEEGIVDLIV